MKYDYLHIQEKLKTKLSSKRYEHTLGVQYIAAALAMRYDTDIGKAQIAGLLHDCARYSDSEKIIKLCKKYNLNLSEAEKKAPMLLHARLGVYLAQFKYNIEDKEILDAIMYHTTGRPNMTLLDKIIYVADFIEPKRRNIPNLDSIRVLAFEDIDLATIKILENTINYLGNNKSYIEPMSIEAYNYYK